MRRCGRRLATRAPATVGDLLCGTVPPRISPPLTLVPHPAPGLTAPPPRRRASSLPPLVGDPSLPPRLTRTTPRQTAQRTAVAALPPPSHRIHGDPIQPHRAPAVSVTWAAMPDDDKLYSAHPSSSLAAVDIKPDPFPVAAAGPGPSATRVTPPSAAVGADTPPPAAQPPAPRGHGLDQPPPMSHPDQQPPTGAVSSFPMDTDTPSTRASAPASFKDEPGSDSNAADTPSAATPSAGPPPSVILRIPASARQSSPASSAGKRKRRSE